MTEEIIYKNDIQAAIEAGKKLAAVQNITRDIGAETHFIVKDGYSVQTLDNKMLAPNRKKGSKTFVSAKSFCSYVNKHKDSDETVIIADEDEGNICAILNDHGVSAAQWSDFKAKLKLGFSEQWKIWYENAHPRRTNAFSQAAFADFIEDNRADMKTGIFKDSAGEDVENLSPLELSALVINLNITSEEKFSSKIDRVTGEEKLFYENEETGKGEIVLPRQIFLAIPVYRGGDLFEVKVRLRRRIKGGTASFHYIIDQIPLLKEAAFEKICQRVTNGNAGSEENEAKRFKGTGIEVLKGKF